MPLRPANSSGELPAPFAGTVLAPEWAIEYPRELLPESIFEDNVKNLAALFGPLKIAKTRDPQSMVGRYIYSIRRIEDRTSFIKDGAAFGPGSAHYSLSDSIQSMLAWVEHFKGCQEVKPKNDSAPGIFGPLTNETISQLELAGQIPHSWPTPPHMYRVMPKTANARPSEEIEPAGGKQLALGGKK